MNKKSNGFTLIELITIIVISSLLLSIAGGFIFLIINNSKEKSILLAENNIKKSANLYALEYQQNIGWDYDEENNLYSCVSIKSLVEMGYLKKEQVINYEKSYVKIVNDNNNTILYEKIDDDSCKIKTITLKIPINKKVCNNLIYSGSDQVLLNYLEVDEGYDLYVDNEQKESKDIKGINAGEYKINFKLNENYIWDDETKEQKTVNCSIKKATPVLELESLGNDYTIGTKTIKLKSSITGTVYLKSSNSNYVTATFLDNNIIEKDKEKEININMLATRDTSTYITITVIPSNEYKNNYYTSSIIYEVGNIKKIKLEKPNSSFCEKIHYNGTTQNLIDLNKYKGYNFEGYRQIEIGKYLITAVPQYGYIWKDGSTDKVTFECEIKEDEYIVTLDSKDATNRGTEKIFWKYDSGLYLDEAFQMKLTTSKPKNKKKITLPTKIGYKFDGYYTKPNGEGNLVIKTDGYLSTSTIKTLQEYLGRNAVTLYAKWTPIVYTVTYYQGNAKSSGGATKLTTSKCTYDTICTLKKYSGTFPSSSTGWSFYGWTDKKDSLIKKYENEDSFMYNLAENLNLYVIGIKSFDFYSGISPITKLNTESIIQYWNPYSIKEAFLTAIILPTPTEIPSWNFIGYTFGSSTTDPKKINYDTSKIGISLKLTYNLKKTVSSLYERPLSIKFNPNSGTGTMANIVKSQYYNSGYASNNKNKEAKISPTDMTFKLSKNIFTKNGYTFTKWAEGSTAGIQYAENANYKKLNPSVDSTNTTQEMYALWKANTYTITLNNQSANTAGTKIIYGKYDSGLYFKKDYTDELTSKKNITVPKKTGYTFGGYYTKTEGNGIKRINIQGLRENNFTANTYTANATLYAKWTANKYKVTFDVNGGTEPSFKEKEVTYNKTYGDLPTTSKTNKKFAGWYTAKSGGTKIEKSTKVATAKNHTLYAHWNDLSETVKLEAYNWSGTSSDCIDTKNKCQRKSVNISGYTKFKVKLKKYLDGSTPPSNTSWGEVELRQGTSGSEGKGTLVIEGGKYYDDKDFESGWLNVSDYFGSSKSVSLLCLAVGYTGEAKCEITFKG